MHALASVPVLLLWSIRRYSQIHSNIAPLPRSSPSRVTFMYESPSEGRRPGHEAKQRATCNITAVPKSDGLRPAWRARRA